MAGQLLCLDTDLGRIALRLRPDAAPATAAHVAALASSGLYDGACFYRSDFVIQCGAQAPDGRPIRNPHPDLPVNETRVGPRVSNTRGTAAVAHWDVPDNGNSEWFINLQANPHLDDAYGGYCVFAECEGSLEAVDRIAQAVKQGQRPRINRAAVS